MVLPRGMLWGSLSLRRKERGVRMIVLYENSPKTFKTYLRTNSFKYIEQVDMKWTNGTQSYCDGELQIYVVVF